MTRHSAADRQTFVCAVALLAENGSDKKAVRGKKNLG